MVLPAYEAVLSFFHRIKARADEQIGATAVEYALMVALIAVVIIAAVSFVGHAASNQFSTVGNCVNAPNGC